MRRIIVAILLLVLSFPMLGQDTIPDERVMPKDSLPDLWVITVDLSGSMRRLSDKVIVDNNNNKIKETINNLIRAKVESIMRANRVDNNDKVLIMGSGIDKYELLCSVRGNENLAYFRDGGAPRYRYGAIRFAPTFVHLLDKNTKSFEEAMSYLDDWCSQTSHFNRDLSFTSLIRPLSMHVLRERKTNYSSYRNIYHVLVTDDGETNDEWNGDYLYLKQDHTKPHFDTICSILPTIACSNFDFVSKRTAKFEEVCHPWDSTKPCVYLTQYITYQEQHPDTVLLSDALVSASAFHDNRFTLRMKPCGDSIGFVHVETCRVNGHSIGVNRYLYPSDTIVVYYNQAFANTLKNSISVYGTYQEDYHDRILGMRCRTVAFPGSRHPKDAELNGYFISAETRVKEIQYLKALAVLLLAVLLFCNRWRNRIVLRIYVHGKCMMIRRKAINKFRNGQFTLVSVAFHEQGETTALFYKGKGIKLELDKATKEWDNKLIIKSNRELSPDCKGFELEPKKEKKRNVVRFDEHNQGASIHISFANRLSHDLLISFVKAETTLQTASVMNTANNWHTNKLRDCNLNMLACYYEQNAEDIDSICNNVQVNIIPRGVLGDEYEENYAVLNIFDLNSRNMASRVFLRYSMMCFYKCTDEEAAVKLFNVARYVLKQEHKKADSFAKTGVVYNDVSVGDTGVTVDVSPMLTYLYLIKHDKKGLKKKNTKYMSRLVYSPFADGRPPRLDGHYGLDNKTVKVFPNSVMTLLNLPIMHPTPDIKIEDDSLAISKSSLKKTETLYFNGEDVVAFLNSEIPYTNGLRYNGHFISWDIEDCIFDITR